MDQLAVFCDDDVGTVSELRRGNGRALQDLLVWGAAEWGARVAVVNEYPTGGIDQQFVLAVRENRLDVVLQHQVGHRSEAVFLQSYQMDKILDVKLIVNPPRILKPCLRLPALHSLIGVPSERGRTGEEDDAFGRGDDFSHAGEIAQFLWYVGRQRDVAYLPDRVWFENADLSIPCRIDPAVHPLGDKVDCRRVCQLNLLPCDSIVDEHTGIVCEVHAPILPLCDAPVLIRGIVFGWAVNANERLPVLLGRVQIRLSKCSLGAKHQRQVEQESVHAWGSREAGGAWVKKRRIVPRSSRCEGCSANGEFSGIGGSATGAARMVRAFSTE